MCILSIHIHATVSSEFSGLFGCFSDILVMFHANGHYVVREEVGTIAVEFFTGCSLVSRHLSVNKN